MGFVFSALWFNRKTTNMEWAAILQTPLQPPRALPIYPLHLTPLREVTTKDVLLSSRKTHYNLGLWVVTPLNPSTQVPAPNWS